MRVLVTGATSMIGDFLLPRLCQAGHEVIATSRKEHPPQQGIQWLRLDLSQPGALAKMGQVDVWINLTSLSLLRPAAAHMAESMGISRLIAFSSTSKFTKADARSSMDRRFARELKKSEDWLEAFCAEHGIHVNILRPTMIYCRGRDKNVTTILRFIERFGFFPLVGGGKGLRQPVHAEDLAMACMQILEHNQLPSRGYNLSGGEILSYREMVERLFAVLNRPVRIVPVPLFAFRWAIALARLLPGYRFLTPDMACRIMKDMVFSHQAASRDFGYKPRPFQP